MDAQAEAFLFRLLDTASPAGFETEAARVWRAEAATFADEVLEDANGNSYARLRGAGPTVLIEGHIDEIGLMISHIDDAGFCWLQPIGGWDAAALVGQHVRVLARGGAVVGVIGRNAAHLLTPEQRDKAPRFESLWLDIGAADGASAREIVSVGDPAVIEAPPRRLAGDLLAGRGLDNHVGAWAALQALRELASGQRPAADVWAVASVQEEIGLWGSITAAYRLEPDVALAIDVWHAADYPDADQRARGNTRLGGGPTVARGANVHPRVAELLLAAAANADMPVQTRHAVRGDTEVVMSHVRAGCATGALGIPLRYMHSPCETLSLTDLENVARLAAAGTRRVAEVGDWGR